MSAPWYVRVVCFLFIFFGWALLVAGVIVPLLAIESHDTRIILSMLLGSFGGVAAVVFDQAALA